MKSHIAASALLAMRAIHSEVTKLCDAVVHVLHGKLEMKESKRANENEQNLAIFGTTKVVSLRQKLFEGSLLQLQLCMMSSTCVVHHMS